MSKLIQFLNLTSEAVIDKELITLNPFTAPRKMLKRRLTCSYLLAEKEYGDISNICGCLYLSMYVVQQTNSSPCWAISNAKRCCIYEKYHLWGKQSGVGAVYWRGLHALSYNNYLSCLQMWTVFGAYASRYGYLPRNNFKCAGYSALPVHQHFALLVLVFC